MKERELESTINGYMESLDSRMVLIGTRIKACRKAAGMTQAELLGKLGMSEKSAPSLRNYEQGKSLPDTKTLFRMADIFGCDIGFLIGDYDAPRRELDDVCKQTGLNPEAARKLQEFKANDKWIASLNLLLCAQNFPSILTRLSAFADEAERLSGLKAKRRMVYDYAPSLKPIHAENGNRVIPKNVTREYTEAEEAANQSETKLEVLEYQLDTWFRRILDDMKEGN